VNLLFPIWYSTQQLGLTVLARHYCTRKCSQSYKHCLCSRSGP